MEIINPETLEPVPDGEIGELVLTTLDRDAMPLLRYRTRDLSRIIPGEVSLRTNSPKRYRLKGRSDDMFIVKGVNIFPMQIEKILLQFKELGTNYLITIETIGNNDELMIDVELRRAVCRRLQPITTAYKRNYHRLKDEILLTPKVKLVDEEAFRSQMVKPCE